ncbi:hypothetical protein BCY90_15595 [Agrobacterium deltaense]|uniref:DUF262 domain-containing protein n=1 Tax=Agrobacterium TaxID=357 RepID=UPI000745AAE4|nr:MULTISPECIES: DUF262 domain-containing protein [Agrobacterium]KVK54334.1 hypothetical protein L901_18355 [Agrobacterium sp. D14]RKF41744.1 hypothetical protein BCY90_15595 [Agrobacterium deltaense]
MAENKVNRTIEPVHQSVAKLLGSQHTFQAPRYQRNYAWGWTEITAFLHDLNRCVRLRIAKESSRHHFFGGLVTVEAKVAGSSRTNLQVVDGQQRLATFAMLVGQLKRILLQLAGKLPGEDPLQQTLSKRAQLLQDQYEIFADEIRLQNVDVPRIQLSEPDQTFFAALLAGSNPKADRKSHELLSAAYHQIGQYLDELVEETDGNLAAAAERLHDVHEVLKSDWTIIHMAAGDKADAYMLFQVLNDRGLSLTEGELLRSATLELLEPVVGLPELNEAEECWNEMLSGDTLIVRNALGGLYASQVGQWPSKSTLLDDYMIAFFPATVGITLDRRTAAELLQQVRNLKDDFDRVKSISAGDWPFAPSQRVNQWKRNRLRLLILHLRYTDAIPLLVSACQLRDTVFADVVRLVERFAFRYAVLGDGNRGRAIEVLNRHAVAIRREAGEFRIADLRHDLAALSETYVSEETFRQALANMRYSRTEATNKPLKYLLMTLEDYARWHADGGQGSPTCRDETRILDFETGTIEHVYAENTEPADSSLLPLMDTLGNLTYLSSPENIAAGAKPFSEKRPYFANSSSLLNRQISENVLWTPEIVESRTEALVAMAVRTFTI